VDIGASTKLELVDKFCYLEDAMDRSKWSKLIKDV